MTKITNATAGVRIVNAKVEGQVKQVSLKPGETKDLDVVETKAHTARVKSGMFRVGNRGAQDIANLRNADGDTLEMAEMRKRFDAAFTAVQTELQAEQAKVADLENQLAVAKQGGDPNGGAGYVVKDKNRGWFAITKDGAEVTKSLREDDVKGFDEMSDVDKAAFVELHKPD